MNEKKEEKMKQKKCITKGKVNSRCVKNRDKWKYLVAKT